MWATSRERKLAGRSAAGRPDPADSTRSTGAGSRPAPSAETAGARRMAGALHALS